MSCALDVNILLYASDAASPFHAAAKSFLETCARGPDLVQHGIRRLATRDRDFLKFDGLDAFDPLETA